MHKTTFHQRTDRSMRPELTARQLELYTFLKEQITRRGRTPSLREAADDLGISHMAVSQQIRNLEAKGYLRRERRYGRSIQLIEANFADEEQEDAGRWVPIVGKIAAGLPLYAQQAYDGRILVDRNRYPSNPLFALRVSGESMVKAGILDNDLVICEPRQFAGNGEIVVALIRNEEATVKRFFLSGQRIELRPESDAHDPMFFDLGEVLIQGKVVGLYRGPESF
jgi:repressor LexA